jgi:hypothetical protein
MIYGGDVRERRSRRRWKKMQVRKFVVKGNGKKKG